MKISHRLAILLICLCTQTHLHASSAIVPIVKTGVWGCVCTIFAGTGAHTYLTEKNHRDKKIIVTVFCAAVAAVTGYLAFLNAKSIRKTNQANRSLQRTSR